MLTEFGKYVRKLRIENEHTLKDLASAVGVSSASLSCIENGKENVSGKVVEGIIHKYGLNENESEHIKQLAELSAAKYSNDLSGCSSEDRLLMMEWYKIVERIPDLSSKEKDEFKRLLEKYN